MKSAKGSQFERDFSRKLSLWFSDGKYDDVFWRVGGSGGRATIRAKQGKSTANQNGDITATRPSGLAFTNSITVELKKGYKDWEIQDAVSNKVRASKSWNVFMKTVKRQRKEAKVHYWWLVLEKNRREPLLIVCREFYNDLLFQMNPQSPLITLPKIIVKGNGNEKCVIFNLDTFMEYISPITVLKVFR